MNLSKNEIISIQSNGIDWAGQPLVKDGDYGPRTQWWNGILSLDSKRQAVQKLALGYHAANVGVELTGHNDGPFIDMLFKPVGMQEKGYPWCCALVSHVYRECGVAWPVYHTSAWQIIQWAKKNGKIVTSPLPSDIEVFLYPAVPGQDRKGHARIVTGYDIKTGRTAGVDGNVGNTIRVGYRDIRPERYFVRPNGLTHQSGALTMPANLIDLDGLLDR